MNGGDKSLTSMALEMLDSMGSSKDKKSPTGKLKKARALLVEALQTMEGDAASVVKEMIDSLDAEVLDSPVSDSEEMDGLGVPGELEEDE